LSRLGPPLLIRFGRKTERKRNTIVTLVIRQLQAQEARKRQEAIIMAFTRSLASAEQTKPGNPSYFGFEEAGPESDKVLDAEGNRRYSTVAFAIAKPMRDGEVKQRTTFKIDQMTVTEWIGIKMKAFPLLFYASFGLMAAPPLGTRCRTCGKIHGREVCPFQGINGKPGDSLAGCDYAFCDDKGKHAKKVCPTSTGATEPSPRGAASSTQTWLPSSTRRDMASSRQTGRETGEQQTGFGQLSA
jgi:hypothetical protein